MREGLNEGIECSEIGRFLYRRKYYYHKKSL